MERNEIVSCRKKINIEAGKAKIARIIHLLGRVTKYQRNTLLESGENCSLKEIMSSNNQTQNKRLLQSTTQQSINPKKPKHWSLGLLDSMKDPDSIVKSTENVVVIGDKYPKAKIHYLVLPHEEISSIYKLNKSHISLLEEFGDMFKDIQDKEDYILKAGFHAVPSMQRLHMHIISNDMVSPCLKTKIHWNSFTTEFFLPFTDVLKELKENGSIQRMSNETHKKLMSTELQCNQCSYNPKNMPQLKEHLLSHCK